MTEVFLKLINMSITAGWIVLAVILLRFLLKKAPRGITCALWALVAVRLVFPFSIESVLSLIPSAETVPEEIVYAREPVINSGVPIINQTVNPIITHSFAPPDTLTSINPIQVFLAVAANLWILGMIAMLLYAAISYLRLRKQIAEAVETEKGVFVCDRISTPFILGIFRPRIILPSSMAEADREYVLAHERAHLRRRDHLWKPLGFALLTVYWFNPVLWVAYILLCRDIELACDERVIRDMGTAEKQAYTTALLNCSMPRRMIAACPLAFGEVGVKQRIRNALHYKKPAFWIIAVAIVASIVFAVCFLTDPKAEEELPAVYGHSYRVEEVVYGAPHLSYMMIAGENTPVYTITDDMHLLRKEAGAEAEWEDEGELRSFILSPETFDQKFMGFGYIVGSTDQARLLRVNNANVWYLPYSDGLCYVLQQKDGSIYLAYGHSQETFSWVFKLEADVTEDTGWIAVADGETVPLILSDAPIEEVKDLVHWLDITASFFRIYCDGIGRSGWYSLYDAETLEPVEVFHPSGVPQEWGVFSHAENGRDYIVGVYVNSNDNFYFGARWSGFPETVSFSHETTVAYAGYISNYAIITGALNRDKMLESSIQHLPIYKFESEAELAKFQSDFAEDIATRAHGEVPCFDVVAKQYDAEFFEEKALFIVYVESGSGSCRYDVGSVAWGANSSSLVIHAEVTRSPITADMAGWFLCVAMDKSLTQLFTTVDADLNAVSHADKLIGKWSALATNMGILDEDTPEYSEWSYIFFADGKGLHTVDETVSEFTYTTEGRLLRMRFARASGMEDTKTFVYTVNGDTLTLTDELAAYRSATLTKTEMDADAYSTEPLTEDEAKLLQEWCGAYQYDEFWLNPNNGVYEGVTYEIDVYTQENGVYARFRANGFQTMIDAIARVKGNQERIELYPIWISSDSFPAFPMDAMLLALYNENGVIKTQWGSWTPDIQEEENVYFERKVSMPLYLFNGQDLPAEPKTVDRFAYYFDLGDKYPMERWRNVAYLDNGMLQVTDNGNFAFSFSIYQDALPYVEPLYTLLNSIVTVDYEGNRFDTLSLANEHITITLNGQATTVSEVRLGAGNGHRDFYITFVTDVMLDLREIRSFSIEVE